MGVLGGGIDTMYPQENFNLYREMYEKGGVLSEYNAGIPNHRGLFPMRNRLISGLADGVFVVQAGRHSGSPINARMVPRRNLMAKRFNISIRVELILSNT
jgi:DNA processing protein